MILAYRASPLDILELWVSYNLLVGGEWVVIEINNQDFLILVG
jgi:hypothetical protein